VDEVALLRTSTLEQVQIALDQAGDFRAAAAMVRQLMFIEKFGDELAGVLETNAAGAD
jgi:hypothetical protein